VKCRITLLACRTRHKLHKVYLREREILQLMGDKNIVDIVVNSGLKSHTNTNYDVWSKGKW